MIERRQVRLPLAPALRSGPWPVLVVLAAGCSEPTNQPPPAASATSSVPIVVPAATVSQPSAPAPSSASTGTADRASTPAPDSTPPPLPPWPASSQLLRSREGAPFLVGELEVDATVASEHVLDRRAVYVEAAETELAGVLEDQRGIARRVTGTLTHDGSFELAVPGQPHPLVRGTQTGADVHGELSLWLWGEPPGHEPHERWLAFRLKRPGPVRAPGGALIGMIGDQAVRVRLTTNAAGTTGRLRRTRGGPSALTGRFDEPTGRFVLDERDGSTAVGQLRVVVARDGGPLVGTWSAADGSGSAFVALQPSWATPEPVALGPRLRLEPRFVLYFGTSCIFDHVWPALAGEGSELARLNRELGAWSREHLRAPTCNEASVGPLSARPYQEQASYEVHPVGGGRFGLELSHWADANGAHGLGSKRCLLVDPAAGRILEPTRLVNESRRGALTALVTRKLLAANGVTNMAELRERNGGSAEGPAEARVSADTDLCVTERGIDVSFEVYEIGPYSMNAPLVSLSRAEARPFFVPDPLMAAVLE